MLKYIPIFLLFLSCTCEKKLPVNSGELQVTNVDVTSFANEVETSTHEVLVTTISTKVDSTNTSFTQITDVNKVVHDGYSFELDNSFKLVDEDNFDLCYKSNNLIFGISSTREFLSEKDYIDSVKKLYEDKQKQGMIDNLSTEFIVFNNIKFFIVDSFTKKTKSSYVFMHTYKNNIAYVFTCGGYHLNEHSVNICNKLLNSVSFTTSM